jgi:hypothetical protein
MDNFEQNIIKMIAKSSKVAKMSHILEDDVWIWGYEEAEAAEHDIASLSQGNISQSSLKQPKRN